MTHERYSQVKSLFQLVLEQPPAERHAFLERACGADRVLYDQVRELLRSDSTSEDFLEKPAVTPLSRVLAEAGAEVQEPMPTQIGPYAVQKLIGSGGMGAVYLAYRADRSYDKLVAIKVIHRGMESDRIIQRFRRERQIIASLDHPNIARLLDGGATADGRPYIVMEYVEGMPITHWCDLKRHSTEMRLKIFLQVCDAIQYAHQNLVIHRDIKPGNILVRPDNSVKLLDFGIAKLLTADGTAAPAEKTATSMRLMTPQYASPEQIKGDNITTASDVYLLGIVLYELLTGRRPYEISDNAALEAMRAFAQGEPQKPSHAIFRTSERPAPDGKRQITINALTISAVRENNAAILLKKLQGGLDAITLRALRRNPAERYQSTAQFAQDIRNYLNELPISALPDNPAYRIRLFLKRNMGITLAVAAAVTLLLLVTAFAIWQATKAQSERQRAEARFSEVRKISNALLFDVQDTLGPLPGTEPARQLLVNQALEYLANLSKESSTDTGLQREVAGGYLRVGHLQGNPNYPNLGNAAGAFSNYRRAQTLFEQLHRQDPKNPEAANDLASTHEAISDMLTLNRDSPGTIESLRRAVQLREEAKTQPEALANSYQKLALALAMAGDSAQAIPLAEKANAITESLTGADAKRQQATAQSRLAAVLQQSGDNARAAASYRASLAIYEQFAAANPLAARPKRDLSFALQDLASVLPPAEAEPLYKRCLQLRRELTAADPQDIRARRDLAYTLLHQGAAEEALDIFRQLSALDPANYIARRDLARAWETQGEIQLKAASYPAALASFRQLLQTARDWIQRDPANPFANQLLALSQMRIAEVLPWTGDRPGAASSARAAIRVLDGLLEKEGNNAQFRRDRAMAQWVLGRVLMEAAGANPEPAAWKEAETVLRRARDLFIEISGRNQLTGEDRAAPAAIAAQIDACLQAMAALPPAIANR